MAKRGRPRKIRYPKLCVMCNLPNLTQGQWCSSICCYFSKVIMPHDEPFTKCWGWQGPHNHFGHGYTKRLLPDNKGNQGGVTCHSVSYQIFVGPIPHKHVVRHMCATRNCSNPEHLQIGTYKDNSQDMVRDGTLIVRSIGKRLSYGEVLGVFHAEGLHADIGAQFGIRAPAVGAIKRGNSHWRITGIPKRLYGDQINNIRIAKIRTRYTKLPDAVVLAIFNDTGTGREIAERHGVTIPRVHHIRRGDLSSKITGKIKGK